MKVKTANKRKTGGLLTAIKNSETTLTQNGALTHKSTNSAVLDFFSLGAAMRNRQESEIVDLFGKAFAEDQLLALKTLFYIRDVRGGQGERRAFRAIIRHLAANYADLLKKNLKHIAVFGRYDDYLELLGTILEKDVISLFQKQLAADSKALRGGESISLCAKWMPSLNTSSEITRKQANTIRKALNLTPKQYRKSLAKLRNHIGVVEKAMCAGKWDGINFENVPSRASLIYRNAFKKHDENRYNEYIGKVEKGEAKINTSALYPYDLVSKTRQGNWDKTVEAQWKNLPDYCKDNPSNALAVIDTSASMTWTKVGNVQPLDIAISMGIYFAERIEGVFKNHFIMFNTTPTLIPITGNTLETKIKKVSSAGVGGSTNLQAVFEMILDAAVANKLKQKEMPDRIFIFSDMEFNACTEGKSNFEAIKEKYKKAKYKMPKMVFWNLNAMQNQAPVKENEQGVVLLSGASPAVLKYLFSSKMVTPYETMLEVLNSDRYSVVTV